MKTEKNKRFFEFLKNKFSKKVIYLILTILILSLANAWDDCPFGEVDEPYPGTCSRYLDTNNDGLCDLSQTEPTETVQIDPVEEVQPQTVDAHDIITGQELKTKTVEEVAALYQINTHLYARALMDEYPEAEIHCSTQFQFLHDNYGLEPSVAKNIAAAMSPLVEKEPVQEPEIKTEKFKERYPFLLLSLIITGIYIISYVLAKKKKISMLKHKRFWNILLLISFLVSALSGIYLVLKINYGFTLPLPNVLWLHVEFGIVMTLISIFHILWHSYYFIGMLKKKRKK